MSIGVPSLCRMLDTIESEQILPVWFRHSESALAELYLQIFQIKKFKDDRIEDDTFQHLTDQDLIRLGVETIGDRIKIEGSNEDDSVTI